MILRHHQWRSALASLFLCLLVFPRSQSAARRWINAGGGPNLFPPSPSPSASDHPYAPVKPAVIIVVGVLTTVFSITFLVLLYSKHCKVGRGGAASAAPASAAPARKNSGVQRSVIDSLPAFRFGALRGRKAGLECAVCLTQFDAAAVLRLLPKCKHAFHVECLDTWLDAHSTCPLCRHRLHPEDVLLVGDQPTNSKPSITESDAESGETCRVSGRHSSAGEKTSLFDLETIPQISGRPPPRRSLDVFTNRRARGPANAGDASVGCFDLHRRKDTTLLAHARTAAPESERRLQHRVIISDAEPQPERWSDPQPSEMLYLLSEMIISDGGRRRLSSSSMQGSSGPQQERGLSLQPPLCFIRGEGGGGAGGGAVDGRCMSEITGLRRRGDGDRHGRQRRAGAVSRWKAWISESLPTVRSDRTDSAA